MTFSLKFLRAVAIASLFIFTAGELAQAKKSPHPDPLQAGATQAGPAQAAQNPAAPEPVPDASTCCAMPDRRECALDRVRGAQMRPMLGGKIKERQQRIAGIKGQGVAATSTASPRMGSPERAQAAPATSSGTGKRSNAKRSAIRMNGALAVCAAVTIFIMPA
jgi:hypothetical protein